MVAPSQDSSAVKATLPEQVRAHILNGIQSWSDQLTTEDLLRIYQDQVSLLFVTEQVRSAIALDPFDHLRENLSSSILERLRRSVAVTNHHSVRTLEGYVRTEASVRFLPSSRPTRVQNRMKEEDGIELHFLYTRPMALPIRVSYTITMTTNATKPPQPLLWVYVDAMGTVPSQNPAMRSVDGWSDIDDDDDDDDDNEDVRYCESCNDNAPPGESKKDKVEPLPSIDADQVDQYEAGMDPDLVSQLIHALQLGSVNDVTVFFLLMTFPFYEHEWDIVGFILDTVFDTEENEDE